MDGLYCKTGRACVVNLKSKTLIVFENVEVTEVNVMVKPNNFESVGIGDNFEYNECKYMKITTTTAFNMAFKRVETFNLDTKVLNEV